MPQVSVIIPTYNRANFVTAAIDSVLAQSYTDYEIIVIDDGSTDNTKEVLQPYRDKIHYIYQPNKGVSAARNTGIKEAQGDWIAFLDSDDRWHCEKLSIQMEFVKENNLKVCFTGNVTEFVTGQLSAVESVDREKIQKRIYADPFRLLFLKGSIPKLSSMVVYRQGLIEAGCFDENLKVSEDTKLFYGLACKTAFGYIDFPLVIFNRDIKRRGLINESSDTKAMLRDSYIQIFQEVIVRYPNISKQNLKMIKSILSHHLSVQAVDLLRNGNHQKARANCLQALSLGGDFKMYRRCLGVLVFPLLVQKYREKN